VEALVVPRTDELVEEIIKDPNRYIAETRRLSKHRNASAARWIRRSPSSNSHATPPPVGDQLSTGLLE